MIRLLQISHIGKERGRFAFDSEDGSYTVTRHPTFHEAVEGCAGMGDVRRIGVTKRREIFAALFAMDGHLHVRVDGQRAVWPGPVVIHRRTVAPFLKSFEMWQDGSRRLSFLYWFDDHTGFPGPEALDVFLNIARAVRSPTDVARTTYVWEASAAGRVIDEDFMRELDKRFGKSSG